MGKQEEIQETNIFTQSPINSKLHTLNKLPYLSCLDFQIQIKDDIYHE